MEPDTENTYIELHWGQLTVRHRDNPYYSPNYQTLLAVAKLRDQGTDNIIGDVQLRIDHENNVVAIGQPRSLTKGIHYTRVLDIVTLTLESGGIYTVQRWSI